MKRIACLALVLGAACSDSNVAGIYTAQFTNRADGCSVGWAVDQIGMGTVTIFQEGSDLMATVDGLPAQQLAQYVGVAAFTGSVDGSDVTLEQTGTRMHMSGTCMYTIDSKFSGSIDGDTLEGVLDFRAITDGDCGTRVGCRSRQDFTATRVP